MMKREGRGIIGQVNNEELESDASPVCTELGTKNLTMISFSDEVESSPNLAKETVQEELVTAFDEETQAGQEKKDEVDFKKSGLEEVESTFKFVKDSNIRKSPQDTEQETFGSAVQTSVPNETLDAKMHAAKDVVENPPAECTPTNVDTTQSAKSPTGDIEMGAAEGQIPCGKGMNMGKGIKRAFEEDTEELVESQEVQEGREKKSRKIKQAMSTSPQPQVEGEDQEERGTPQEEEAEAMETEATQVMEPENSIKTQKRFELAGITKGDEGSRDGEGDELGEDEGDKKDIDGQEKDKDDGKEDEESSTPSRRRKKKKRSYERPRGEGGKFMKEKPGMA